jgi:hypothetical protein
MKTFIKSAVLAAAVFALGAGSANATVIDFSTGSLGGPGGTINIGANITGSGIFIDALTITGAPINNGLFGVEGAGVCGDAVGGCGVLSFDKNLNTITLVGSIPALGILAPINLLSGDLSGGVTVAINDGFTGAITASGHDTKGRELLLAIGMDPATQFTYFGFTGGFSGGQGSPYTAISTDIINTSTGGGTSGQNLVPEPGSLVLFGTGLFGAATRLRRRYSTKA